MTTQQHIIPMFRFTIRDLLWLTAITAVGAGWWVSHSHQAAQKIEAAKIHHSDIAELQGEIEGLKQKMATMRAKYQSMYRRAELERAAEVAGFTFSIGRDGWSLNPSPTASHPTTTSPPTPK
jgi:hypothetical protein